MRLKLRRSSAIEARLLYEDDAIERRSHAIHRRMITLQKFASHYYEVMKTIYLDYKKYRLHAHEAVQFHSIADVIHPCR